MGISRSDENSQMAPSPREVRLPVKSSAKMNFDGYVVNQGYSFSLLLEMHSTSVMYPFLK